MRFIILALAIGLYGCASQFEQRENVVIDRSNDERDPEEPCIMISGNNPDNLVVGANINNMYTSFDGGLTWEHQAMTSDLGVFGDPVVITDAEGGFLFFHLSDTDQQGWNSEKVLDRMVCQRSTDGGKTWTAGTGIGFNTHRHDQDKEWAVRNVDNGEIYLTWTQFDKYGSTQPGDSSNILFSKSTDNGATWSEPMRINKKAGICLDDDFATEGAFPTVMANGDIGVVWAYGDHLYFDISTDGGETWLDNDLIIANIGGGWNYDIPCIMRANGLPVMKTDLSLGPNRGTIYINWSDQRNGTDDTDVWLIHSKDNGKTWSEPQRVNNDAAGKHQFFCWMDIDQRTGNLYFVYYDRRNHDDCGTDVYFSWSDDGGNTFKHRKISETPFFPSENAFFGDYSNLVAQNGIIYPVWTRMDSLDLSLITTRIEIR